MRADELVGDEAAGQREGDDGAVRSVAKAVMPAAVSRMRSRRARSSGGRSPSVKRWREGRRPAPRGCGPGRADRARRPTGSRPGPRRSAAQEEHAHEVVAHDAGLDDAERPRLAEREAPGRRTGGGRCRGVCSWWSCSWWSCSWSSCSWSSCSWSSCSWWRASVEPTAAEDVPFRAVSVRIGCGVGCGPARPFSTDRVWGRVWPVAPCQYGSGVGRGVARCAVSVRIGCGAGCGRSRPISRDRVWPGAPCQYESVWGGVWPGAPCQHETDPGPRPRFVLTRRDCAAGRSRPASVVGGGAWGDGRWAPWPEGWSVSC